MSNPSSLSGAGGTAGAASGGASSAASKAAGPLAAVLAITGAATGAISASNQNRSIRRLEKSVRRSADTQIGQVTERLRVDRLRRFQETSRIRGALRVAAAEGGQGFEGSFAQLSLQADIDQATNDDIAELNAFNDIEAIRTNAMAQLTQLASQEQDPILAGITGGIGGAIQGLTIAGLAKGSGSGSVGSIGGGGPDALPSFAPGSGLNINAATGVATV